MVCSVENTIIFNERKKKKKKQAGKQIAGIKRAALLCNQIHTRTDKQQSLTFLNLEMHSLQVYCEEVVVLIAVYLLFWKPPTEKQQVSNEKRATRGSG